MNDNIKKIAMHGRACRIMSEFSFYNRLKSSKELKSLNEVHFSRETLKPYYQAWCVQKQTIWKESLNRHILLHDQAGLLVKAQSDLFSAPPTMEEDNLKPLGMKYFIGFFIVWAIMNFISIIVFFGKTLYWKIAHFV